VARAAPARGGGTLTFAWGGRLRIDGIGIGGRATAANFGTWRASIRPEELAAGRIEHALFIVLRCSGSGASFGYGVRQRNHWTGVIVIRRSPGASSCGEHNGNLPPLGAHFQLAMSRAQIAALATRAWKRAISPPRTLRRYVGDTGGPGFAFAIQSSATYTSFGAPDRLVQVARGAGITAGGGRYVFDISDGVDCSATCASWCRRPSSAKTPEIAAISAATRMSVRSSGI